MGDEDVVGGVMEGRLVAMGTCPWCCSFLRCGSVTGPHMISFQMLAGPRTCGTRCRRPACNVWGSGCTRNSRMWFCPFGYCRSCLWDFCQLVPEFLVPLVFSLDHVLGVIGLIYD